MRALLRALAFLAFLMAFVLLVVDATTIISAKAFSYTSVAELVQRMASAGALERWGATVSRGIHPLVWGAINLVVFSGPAVVIAAVVGLILMMLGRRPESEMAIRLGE